MTFFGSVVGSVVMFFGSVVTFSVVGLVVMIVCSVVPFSVVGLVFSVVSVVCSVVPLGFWVVGASVVTKSAAQCSAVQRKNFIYIHMNLIHSHM